MDFLRRLFGRRPTPKAPLDLDAVSPAVANSIALMKAKAQPCIRLSAGGDGRSRLGGVPDLAGQWPRYDGRPLSCVAQLDLAQLRAAGGPDWLPEDGRLLFFYELEHGSWGINARDAGSAVVIHETAAPLPTEEPKDLPEEARFPAYPVAFVSSASFPSEERLGIDWSGFNAASADALEQAMIELAPDSPMHQIGGYPSPVQNDSMESQCHDVARRLGQRGGDATDWRLLLQLDTDDEAGMMWGDVGSLYFWIREEDARAGDFAKAWMILQCH